MGWHPEDLGMSRLYPLQFIQASCSLCPPSHTVFNREQALVWGPKAEDIIIPLRVDTRLYLVRSMSLGGPPALPCRNPGQRGGGSGPESPAHAVL